MLQRPAEESGIRISATPDPFTDVVMLTCRFPRAPALLQVSVLDAEGRMRRRLLDWHDVAHEVELTWDGGEDRARPLPARMYIIFAQASAADGTTSGKRVVIRR